MKSSQEPGLVAQILELVAAPFRTVRQFFRELLAYDDRLRHADTPLERLTGLLTLPIRFIRGCIAFIIFCWSSSRSGSAFMLGLPALLVMVAIGSAYLLADFIQNEAKRLAINTGYYYYHEETAPDRPEWSEMFARKLMELKPDDPEYQFMLARMLDKQERDWETMDLMTSLAGNEFEGFAKADIWLAKNLKDEADAGDDENIDALLAEAQEHLESAVVAEPKNSQAIFQLADLLRQQANRRPDSDPVKVDELKRADELFQSLTTGDVIAYRILAFQPAVLVRLDLCDLLPNSDKYQRAKEVQRVNTEVNSLLSITRTRYPNLFFIWESLVSALVAIDEPARAVAVLNEAHRAATSLETKLQLRRLNSRVLLFVSARPRVVLRPTERETYHQRIDYICRAIVTDVTNKLAYQSLLRFAGKPPAVEPDPNAQASDRLPPPPINLRWLQEEVTQGESGVLYSLIGMYKISSGDFEGGKNSWRIAQQFDRRAQIYLFHLLDVATRVDTERFDHLLDMLALAIEMFPDEPGFYVNRGIYLKNQQRYSEAIQDLEHVMDQLPKMLQINQQLKFCYQKMGDNENALRQEQLIQEKLAAQSVAERKRSEQLLARLEAVEAERNQ